MILHGRKAMVQQISGLRPLSAKIVKSSRQISQNLAILKTFSTQNKCITNLLSNIIEIRNRKSQRKWKRYLHVLTTIQDIIPCTQRLRNQDVGIIMTPPPPPNFFFLVIIIHCTKQIIYQTQFVMIQRSQSKVSPEEECSSLSFDGESAELGMCTYRDHQFSFPVPVGIPFSVRIQLLRAFVDD